MARSSTTTASFSISPAMRTPTKNPGKIRESGFGNSALSMMVPVDVSTVLSKESKCPTTS